MEFTCNNGKCLSGEEEINYKGKIESGKVRIYADSKIELCVTDNKSSALKTIVNKEVEVVSGTCDYGELNYTVTALVSKEALDEMTEKYNSLKGLVDQIIGTNRGIKKILLGGAGTYDLKTNYATYGLGIDDYKNLTVDNFLVIDTTSKYVANAEGTGASYGYFNPAVVTYSSGILTITASQLGCNQVGRPINYQPLDANVYLVY